jgi:tRNA-specific 2-thiouridylase
VALRALGARFRGDPGMRVLAAMSGGVDSAVAAARAAEDGHDVTGIHLALSRNPKSYRTGARGCCTIEDSNDARRAADIIGIPFYVWDLSDRFHEDVVEDFMDEYAAGRTPNPCLRCNEKIKFAAVLDRGLALGFDAVATGHYAQLRTGADGLIEMHRAVDMAKDQSYVLGVLTQDQLAHSLFPLGDTTKPVVRREAADRGLLVADKPDSHDICFVADGDNAGWLKEKLGDRLPNTGGDIVDSGTGEVLGQHDGTVGFTIGQRRGLRLGTPAADGKPRFVLDIEPVSGTVSVGPREGLRIDRIVGIKPRWCGTVPSVLDGPDVTVQLRAHGGEHRATVRVGAGGRGDEVEIELLDPAEGIAPGQAAVIYDGTRVVGSATISATARSQALESDLQQADA